MAHVHGMQSEDYFNLCHQVCTLHHLIEAALPSNHPLAFAFHKAVGNRPDDHEPHPDLLNAALAAFDALPVKQRQMLLNGWKPATFRPSSSEQKASDAELDFIVRRMMILGLNRGGAKAVTRYVVDDDIAPVSLRIVEGTPKRVVLDAMDDLRSLISELYADLISACDEEGDHGVIDASEAAFKGMGSGRFRPPLDR